MYDKFEPFKSVQKQPFTFTPSRFESWMNGKMVNSGSTHSPIRANVIAVEGQEKVEISISDVNLHGELAPRIEFDEFITAHDRLQLVTVPAQTNANCVGMAAMQSTIRPTRQQKNFATNEPYCCNLFIQEGSIAKITFSFGSPEKLVEFYPATDGIVRELDFLFKSSEFIQYENGKRVSQGGARNAIKVEPNPQGNDFVATIYNLDGKNHDWYKEIQMTPKPMRIVDQNKEKIQLRGVGTGTNGVSLENIGLTVYHNEGVVIRVELTVDDQGYRVEYLP
ncbi:MAG: hypothetical protein L6Q81_17015 [Bacteroidia bacterium]|nr:hypothetical protein [Bacteroidia bacterium]